MVEVGGKTHTFAMVRYSTGSDTRVRINISQIAMMVEAPSKMDITRGPISLELKSI